MISGNAVGPLVVKLSNEKPNRNSYECVRRTQEVEAQLKTATQPLPACPCFLSQVSDLFSVFGLSILKFLESFIKACALTNPYVR